MEELLSWFQILLAVFSTFVSCQTCSLKAHVCFAHSAILLWDLFLFESTLRESTLLAIEAKEKNIGILDWRGQGGVRVI